MTLVTLILCLVRETPTVFHESGPFSRESSLAQFHESALFKTHRSGTVSQACAVERAVFASGHSFAVWRRVFEGRRDKAEISSALYVGGVRAELQKKMKVLKNKEQAQVQLQSFGRKYTNTQKSRVASP